MLYRPNAAFVFAVALLALLAAVGFVSRAEATHNTPCAGTCSDPNHPWTPGTFAWTLFDVRPVLHADSPPAPTPSPTPHYLTWQEHSAGRFPPSVVIVSWDGIVETMEILADGTTPGSHPDIRLHKAAADACDSAKGSTVRFGTAPCITRVYYDVDWKEKVNDKQWDWIYFWVRDPDFVAMKAVEIADCSTSQWPYEYVNIGPKYSVCQDFGNVYYRTHGVSGPDVIYNVHYEQGAPATPTAGATVTPPPGKTPTLPSTH